MWCKHSCIEMVRSSIVKRKVLTACLRGKLPYEPVLLSVGKASPRSWLAPPRTASPRVGCWIRDHAWHSRSYQAETSCHRMGCSCHHLGVRWVSYDDEEQMCYVEQRLDGTLKSAVQWLDVHISAVYPANTTATLSPALEGNSSAFTSIVLVNLNQLAS